MVSGVDGAIVQAAERQDAGDEATAQRLVPLLGWGGGERRDGPMANRVAVSRGSGGKHGPSDPAKSGRVWNPGVPVGMGRRDCAAPLFSLAEQLLVCFSYFIRFRSREPGRASSTAAVGRRDPGLAAARCCGEGGRATPAGAVRRAEDRGAGAPLTGASCRRAPRSPTRAHAAAARGRGAFSQND